MADNGASATADRAFVPSGSSQQAVSPVPASIPNAGIIERLRVQKVRYGPAGAKACKTFVNPDGPEAADIITELLEALEIAADELQACHDQYRVSGAEEAAESARAALLSPKGRAS